MDIMVVSVSGGYLLSAGFVFPFDYNLVHFVSAAVVVHGMTVAMEMFDIRLVVLGRIMFQILSTVCGNSFHKCHRYIDAGGCYL